jgi:hypothetical protein
MILTIVSDNNVHSALEYLAVFPHPFAVARKDLCDAENELKRIWGTVYGEQTGPIKDKECATDRDPRVVAARASVSKATFDLETHRARTKAGEMILEIWRTENANARAAERVR